MAIVKFSVMDRRILIRNLPTRAKSNNNNNNNATTTTSSYL